VSARARVSSKGGFYSPSEAFKAAGLNTPALAKVVLSTDASADAAQE